jgi:uncharacterized protein YqgV (UPF0045/DUF77 family)
MPVAPPELVVEFTIEPSRESGEDPQVPVETGKEVADASGLAREAGPDVLALAGGRAEVLEALFEVLEASLDAGAKTVRIKLEVPEARQL